LFTQYHIRLGYLPLKFKKLTFSVNMKESLFLSYMKENKLHSRFSRLESQLRRKYIPRFLPFVSRTRKHADIHNYFLKEELYSFSILYF